MCAFQTLKHSAATTSEGAVQIPQHGLSPRLAQRLNEEMAKGLDSGEIVNELVHIRCAFSGSAAVGHPNEQALS